MRFEDELEEAGEDAVRQNLALGRYGRGRGRDIAATAWLARKDQEREAASKAESLEIARSTKDAGWAAAEVARYAAREAKNANTIATLALVAAVIAIAVSIISTFLG